jgi:hypothetical protein
MDVETEFRGHELNLYFRYYSAGQAGRVFKPHGVSMHQESLLSRLIGQDFKLIYVFNNKYALLRTKKIRLRVFSGKTDSGKINWNIV